MQTRWSSKALSDLGQHRDFLASSSPRAAKRAMHRIFAAVDKLKSMPRLGEQISHSGSRAVRRLLVDKVEIHYEIDGAIIHIVRVWHTRQRR